jgi:hypothetical protein
MRPNDQREHNVIVQIEYVMLGWLTFKTRVAPISITIVVLVLPHRISLPVHVNVVPDANVIFPYVDCDGSKPSLPSGTTVTGAIGGARISIDHFICHNASKRGRLGYHHGDVVQVAELGELLDILHVTGRRLSAAIWLGVD